MAKVYTTLPAGFSPATLPARPEPRRVLLCTPTHFDIVDVKNVHMEGMAGHLDKALAVQQWQNLRAIYESLQQQNRLDEVLTIEGSPGMEDMVFCANQTFPWLTANGEPVVVMSHMRHASRQREVPAFEAFFKGLGYRPLHLQRTEMFEGMGDCISHPGRRLLYGGWGHRSLPSAYDEIAALLSVDVVPLQLVDERFYHLDTCFVPLNEQAVMLCPEAFTAEGLLVLRQCFNIVIEVPAEEAVRTFSLNAHVLWDEASRSGVAVMQSGAHFTRAALQQQGFTVIETETGEFMKSGGSVFCMKMMLF